MASNFASQNATNSELAIPVSALNQAVAQLLERNFPLTWVSGEISNFTRATSGHWYFTLKDHAAQVRAVMFRGRAQYANFIPQEGDKVEVRALVGLYAPRGDFQINVEAIRRAGVGNLYEAFLQLKEKLAREGLFDSERKRNLPPFVKHVGIVTSPNAAALRDVLTTFKRRAPHLQITIFPCPVQGETAGAQIAQAVATASSYPGLDLLIVCRGGGSIEDLWAFNDETLARTIAHSEIPVISGVGHETDFTICDFVADLRAPTPTAAAELASMSRQDYLSQISSLQNQLARQMRRHLDGLAQKLDWSAHRLLSPMASIDLKRQHVLQCAQSLRYSAQRPLQNAQSDLRHALTRLQNNPPKAQQHVSQLQHSEHRLKASFSEGLRQQQSQLHNLRDKLDMLNPRRTLERGYSILQKENGELIRSGQVLHPDETLTLHTAQDSTQIRLSKVAKPKAPQI